MVRHLRRYSASGLISCAHFKRLIGVVCCRNHLQGLEIEGLQTLQGSGAHCGTQGVLYLPIRLQEVSPAQSYTYNSPLVLITSSGAHPSMLIVPITSTRLITSSAMSTPASPTTLPKARRSRHSLMASPTPLRVCASFLRCDVLAVTVPMQSSRIRSCRTSSACSMPRSRSPPDLRCLVTSSSFIRR